MSARAGNLSALADISVAELENLRQALHHVMAIESGIGPSPIDLSCVDTDRFVQTASRHRLSVCFGPHVEALNLPEDARARVARRAAREQLIALQCAAALAEAVGVLTDDGMRVLAVKGIALALQTTGAAAGRGSGDIDLWVAEPDVTRARELLAGIGYVEPPGAVTMPISGRVENYRMWSGFELELVRGKSPLDLHWSLTTGRRLLPTFDDAWNRREFVSVAGREVPTLSLNDAFTHTCLHAYKDGWRWLRSLVDVARLARRIPANDLAQLALIRPVALSALIAHDAAGGAALEPLLPHGNRAIERARATADAQQRGDAWTLDGSRARSTWVWLHQQLDLANGPRDIARTVSSYALPPNSLGIGADGATHGAMEVLSQRISAVSSRARKPSSR
ncbi:MAG: nucleotidyltransferase family protein [Actinomycetes bacterium]